MYFLRMAHQLTGKIATLILIMTISFYSFGQSKHQKSRVKLISGEVFKVKSLILSDTSVQVLKYNSAKNFYKYQSYGLDKMRPIEEK